MDAVGSATQPSKLLPLLFERLPEDRPLAVLDVGSGDGDTIAFFGDFRCHLHFADLFGEAVVREPQDDATEEELIEQFQRALDLPEDVQFDICLFWDFFNYVDGPALTAFVEALRPNLHRATRSHGFGMLNARSVLNNNHYGVRRRDLLSYRRRPEPQLPVYPHSQRELNQSLGYFNVVKSLLMVDGRLEFILDCRSVYDAREPRKSVFNF